MITAVKTKKTIFLQSKKWYDCYKTDRKNKQKYYSFILHIYIIHIYYIANDTKLV